MKTSDPERDRGFESHPLRHEFNTEWQAIDYCAGNYSQCKARDCRGEASVQKYVSERGQEQQRSNVDN